MNHNTELGIIEFKCRFVRILYKRITAYYAGNESHPFTGCRIVIAFAFQTLDIRQCILRIISHFVVCQYPRNEIAVGPGENLQIDSLKHLGEVDPLKRRISVNPRR